MLSGVQRQMPRRRIGHTTAVAIGSERFRSAVDYVARRLAIDWLPYPDRAALGVFTLAERPRRFR